MASGLTFRRIEEMLADVWLFSHAGRIVQASMILEQPTRVQLVSVGGSPAASIGWDILAALLRADERGSDVVDQWALQAFLGRILDDPAAFGGVAIE